MLNLLRHLDRAHFEPSVFQLRPGPLADRLREIDVPVRIHTPHRMRNVPAVAKTILALAAHVRDAEIDLVHDNGFRAHVYGGTAAWSSGLTVCRCSTPARTPATSSCCAAPSAT